MSWTQPLKVIPLGGLGEIGMNCLVLESEHEIIVIDCGLMFSDLDHFGVEFIIPDFTYLRERRDKIKAVILTHGHEDHIGAIPFAIKAGINAPLYASHFTSLLLRERLKEHGLEQATEIRTFNMGDKLDCGEFKVTPVSVNHSIIDAAALLIDTPYGRIVHTGDFKIDPTPFYGSTLDASHFQTSGNNGALLLLSDSTNVERHTHTISESVVYQKLEQLFKTAQGLTVVSMFSSNVARMGQVLEIADKLGKKVAVAGRSMDRNIGLGQEAGYLKHAERVMIPIDAIDQFKRKDLIILSTGSQGEHRSSLFRMSRGEHPHVDLQKDDLVLMSSRFIPGNEKEIGRMINDLFKRGAEVLYESVHDIHTSGHATKPELEKMIEWVKPKFFMPIHGEYRHLVHHQKLAQEKGLQAEQTLLAIDGQIMELTPTSFEAVGKLEETRVLVEGRDGNDISKLVLKDRRQIGEKGVVFSLMVRNVESRRIIAGPEIIAKGLMNEANEAWMLDEAKNVVLRIMHDYELERQSNRPKMDLQEEIRVQLRRFFNNNLGKKPVVMPVILDI